MAKPGFGCERPECAASTDISEQVSFGTGELDSNGFWEFPCQKCRNAWKLHRPVTCARKVHKLPIKYWGEECPSCPVPEGNLEIVQAAQVTIYDILCHKCNWTTTAIRPVDSEFVCAGCGAHENIGEVIHMYTKKEYTKRKEA